MTVSEILMIVLITLPPAGILEYQNYNMQKQIDNLNTRVSTCPDSKSFSLLTLRP